MHTYKFAGLKVLIASLLLFFAISSCTSERRPVEGKWVVEGARGLQKPSSPLTYHVLKGDQVSVRFVVEQPDLELYHRSLIKLEMPAALKPAAREAMSPGEVHSYVLAPENPGFYDVAVRIDSPETGFRLDYPVRIVVHADISSVEEALCKVLQLGPVKADPAGFDANPEVSPRRQELADAGYAHVYGLALSYAHSNGRRYMLRGLRLELWDGSTYIKSVQTADPIGEGRCESEFNDYVDTSDNSYHHVTNSGYFDFGNVFVGESGKTLTVKEVFQFHAGATGTAADGAHRCTTEEYGVLDNTQIKMEWLIECPSGNENPTWLMSSTFTLSSSNGSLGDEAQHVQLDASRMYHYFAECANYSSGEVTPFIIDLDDTDAPYHQEGKIYLNGWDPPYLWYENTDIIRHEYSHLMMYRMRGDNMPDRNGDVNHGNCSNTYTIDGLIEGFANAMPALVFRDGFYHWTETSSSSFNVCNDYCGGDDSDKHEWAVGRSIWRSWTLAGGTDGVFGNLVGSMANRDPNDVPGLFNGWVQDCTFDRQLWDGFSCSFIDYDTTAPDNPSPITCTTGITGWTNYPTWSWSEPYDDLSGIQGYSILLTPGGTPVLPDTTTELSAVTSYTPASLPADGLYAFSIRTEDRGWNWNSGFTSHIVGIDTVPPGLATGLAGGSPPYPGSWSNSPSLTFAWTAAVDSMSQLDGYSWGIMPNSWTVPPENMTLDENATSLYVTFPSSAYEQWFALRSKDYAGNWSSDAARLGPYFIDTVAPGAVTGFQSTSHSQGVWSNDTTVDFSWTTAADSHSGVDGYSICSNTIACLPVEAKTMEEVTGTTVTLEHSDTGYYTSLRAVDNAGNWANDYVTWGPVLIDTVKPTSPGNLGGSFPLGVEGCVTGDSQLSASWTPSYDGNSGIAAYAYSVSSGDWERPPEADHLPAGATNVSVSVPNSSQPQFFNIMARDAAGNWSDPIAYGPFFHDRAPLPIGDLILSLPAEPSGSLQIDWNGTGELGYLVEWVTGFDTTTPYDWSDNANYGASDVSVQAFNHASPPAAQCVYYRVKGKNACGVLGE